MKTGGRVTETFEREWQGRDGTVILHSFKIEGDNRYFRTGTEQLCEANDLVSFQFDGKNQVSDLTIDGQATTPPPAPARGGSSGSAKGGSSSGKSFGGGGSTYKQKQAEKDQYWADKEARDIERDKHNREVVEPRITLASAQSDAVALVTAALQHDLLAFGNANKGAKLGLLLDFVDQVTARFAEQRYNAPTLLAQILADADSTSGAEDVDDDNDDLG